MIISLSGYCKSGKNTLANYISSKYNFVELSFARKLKIICSTIFNKPLDYWEDKNDFITIPELNNLTKRQVLQNYGQFIRDNQGQNFFINYIDSIIKSDVSKNYIITDVRYLNELDYIKTINSYLMYIERKDCKPVNKHISESYYQTIRDNSDFVIYNNRDLNDLYNAFDLVYQDILFPYNKS